jgi:2,4-dienoyl-CoA reductase-like NADH-dependent reductase (Old Yellow Enzyme family)
MLSVEEISEIVKAFGEAAQRAEEAGFDGVEIHAAHNYLLSQFLSPKYNHREDKYGGNLERRLAFPLEVVSSIRKHVRSDFIVGIRFNAEELVEGGLPSEEGIKIAQVLENAKMDYLNVSQTSTVKLAAFTTTYHPPGSFIYIPETIKKKVSVPVVGVGALHRPN